MVDASSPPEDASPRRCRACGQQMQPGRDDHLCHGCRHEVDVPDDDYTRRRRESRARRTLMAELGIPADAHWSTLTLHGSDEGPEWARYTVEMIGIRAGSDIYPPPWPFYRLGPFLTQVWLRRVRLAGSPVYLEVRWHPERVQTIDLRGLSETTSLGDAQVVLRGLRLLRRLDRRGRTPGSGQYASKDAFHAAHAAALEKFRRENRKPTPDMIADELCLGRSRYYDLRKQWPPPPRPRERAVRTQNSSD